MDIKKDKLFLVLGIVILLGLVGYFVLYPKEEVPLQENVVVNDEAVDKEEVPLQENVVVNDEAVDFPVLFEQRDDLLFEERITKLVSELKRSPVAHFNINISGTVRDFFDRTIIVEARGETIEVPIAEKAVVATEVWKRPPMPEVEADPILSFEELMLFELKMQIEMAIHDGLLPDAPLEEVKTQIDARLPEIPYEKAIPGLARPELVKEPFNLQDISIGDIVRIQATITPIGELQAFEVIVQQID